MYAWKERDFHQFLSAIDFLGHEYEGTLAMGDNGVNFLLTIALPGVEEQIGTYGFSDTQVF